MSENLDRGTRDFSQYDAMSTEALEEILRLDAEGPEGQQSDEELLFYVMGVLADRRNKTEFTGKTALKAYESFRQHYLPCEENIESVPQTGRKTIRWFRPLTAAAAALVIVIGLSVTANAFNWDFWNVVAKWARETFSLVGDGTDVSEPETNFDLEFESIQEALEHFHNDPSMVPSWIPEGFEIDFVKVDMRPMQEVFFAFYRNGEKTIKITVRSYMEADPERIEKSEDLIEIYSVAGIDYYIFANHNQTRAVWIIDSHECYISGELTIDEMKAMIDSIGKG